MDFPGRQPAWLGIDVGTQSVRAAVIDADGRLLGSGSAALRSDRPGPGRHEQEPEDWWAGLGLATRTALGGPAVGFVVDGVAICSTSGTVLLTDHDGRPRTPALMYDDGRAVDQAVRVAAAERALANRGRRRHPSSALPRLLWLLEEAAGRADGVLHLTHCADLLAGRLVGARVATDASHALKSAYDPELEAWSLDLFAALGVPASVLPDVVAPGALLGCVGQAGSRHTGLAVGTPVLAGMTDGCAGQIAAGALDRGTWNSVLGTTLAVKGVVDEPILDPDGGVYSHRHPDGHRWLAGGASNVGAGILTERFPGRDLAELDTAAADHEPSGAVVYPLGSAGERFPFVRADAEPIVLGLLGDEADHYAALLQGVAFAERLCLSRMQALGAVVDGPLRLTGGAARSVYWCQLRADILGRPVRRPAHPEPAVGMAILASAGGGSVTSAAARMVHADLELEPRADRAGRFDEAYARLCDELRARGYVDVDAVIDVEAARGGEPAGGPSSDRT
ncbi:MAG TPA: FGGY family carbohydrate kinase [Solirubrobacteraceae bacterium]|jgi:sugar (pentulose or hexulose) kinase|nr:FGGY family carbohydrate kinase [Solirubrobacteraceae bacterium]